MNTTPARGKTTAKSTTTSYAPKSQSGPDMKFTEADIGKPVTVYGDTNNIAHLVELSDNEEVLVRYDDGSVGLMFETDVDALESAQELDDYDYSINSIHNSGFHIGDLRSDCRLCTALTELNAQVNRVNSTHPTLVTKYGPMTGEKLVRLGGQRVMTAEEFADFLEANPPT